MAMSEMVERVARALFKLDGCTDWDAVTTEIREPWMRQSRAAIAAMREPTEAIVQIMDDCINIDADRGYVMPTGRDIWHSAIDAALAEDLFPEAFRGAK